jgi:SAM-dependent methyltransferase
MAQEREDGARFYGELARWWPLISPVEDYQEEAADVVRMLRLARQPVTSVLELGCGGGHCAHWLQQDFELCLTDLSEEMLACSKRLNPDCEHLLGDMRSLRLERSFDAVLVHDAIDYMASEDDLLAAMTTAFVHCRPGGAVLLLPDHLRETFGPSEEVGGVDGPGGEGIRYLEWSFDPDPTDDWVQTEYAFVLRENDGRVRHVHETHRTGLFSQATWLRLLEEVGFEAEAVLEQTTEDRLPRTAFVGHRSR